MHHYNYKSYVALMEAALYPRHMPSIRSLFGLHPSLVALIFFTALAMKLFVPAGYMISPASKTITVQLCTGMDETQTATIEIPMDPASSDGGQHDSKSDDKAKPCSFGGSGQLALNNIDPVQIALALTFILLAGLRLDIFLGHRAKRRLRPPLRGPPIPA